MPERIRRVCSRERERESVEENTLMKKKGKNKKNVIFCLTLVFPKKEEKKKFSLTYYNRISKLTTILTYVLPRVNPLIINLHAICINYLEFKRASPPNQEIESEID